MPGRAAGCPRSSISSQQQKKTFRYSLPAIKSPPLPTRPHKLRLIHPAFRFAEFLRPDWLTALFVYFVLAERACCRLFRDLAGPDRRAALLQLPDMSCRMRLDESANSSLYA